MAKKAMEMPRKGRSANDYTIVVAYDGEKTEDDYFRGWKLVIPPSRLALIPIFVRSGGNALKAVTRAASEKRKMRDFAEFWCVCDCDDTSDDDLSQAVFLAQKEDIRLCLSNRCFEIWIALHFEKISKPITCEDEAIDAVKKHILTYGDNSKSLNFSVLLPKTSDAIENSLWLSDKAFKNPATNVHVLAKKLLENMPEDIS